jgi:hypothetical protein
MSARPYLQFFPSDWRGSTSLKLVSMAARGLWIEMLCIMHEAEPYGHLMHKGKQVSVSGLGAMVGASAADVESWLKELLDHGVCEAKRNGVLFSARMVRDAATRERNRDNGKKGGNPNLRKGEEISAAVNPPQKPKPKAHIPESRVQSPKPDQEEDSLRSDSSPKADLVLMPVPDDSASVKAAFDAYNAIAVELSLPTAKALSEDRRRKIKARLKAVGMAGWLEALECLRNSPHCRGINDRGWQADLDFLLQQKSFNRLIEGTYGDKSNGPGTGAASSRRGVERTNTLRRIYSEDD